LDDYDESGKKEYGHADRSREEGDEIEEGDHLQENQGENAQELHYARDRK
jgi:hypothetical protein